MLGKLQSKLLKINIQRGSMSIKLKHAGGNSVSLNPPTSAPTSSEVAFKLPNADGSSGQYMKTDGSGNLAFATVSTPPTYTEYSTQTTSGANSYSITITGDPKVLEVSLFEVRHANAQNIMYRISNSSSETSSAYYDISTYHKNGGSDVCSRGLNQGQGCLVNYDFTGADNLITGKAIFTKVNTGLYTFSGIYNMRFAGGVSNDQYILSSSGHVYYTSAVTQFRLFTSSGGNFTSGTINVRGIA